MEERIHKEEDLGSLSSATPQSHPHDIYCNTHLPMEEEEEDPPAANHKEEEEDPQPHPHDTYCNTAPHLPHKEEEEDLGTISSAPPDQPHHPDQETFHSGTYVIQVPQDQIYRVPPPENAAFVHRSRSDPTQHKRSFCSCFIFPLLFILLLSVVLFVIVGIFYLAVRHTAANFSVDRVVVLSPRSYPNSNPNPNSKYEITLKAGNPNNRLGVFYLTGGDAYLSFKQRKIATGNPPAFSTPTDESIQVQLVLSGSNGELPPEVQKSLNGKGSKEESIPLSLSIHIPVKIKLGLMKTWRMNMAISCDLRVNTLAKGSYVMSQGCHNNLHVF